MPMPEKGCPIIWLLYSWYRKRPSNNIFISAVPVDSVGGLPGSIHSLVVVVQLPARLANNLCGSPGVPSFFQSSIIACWSICFSGFLSLATASDVVTTRHREVNRMYMSRIGSSFHSTLLVRLGIDQDLESAVAHALDVERHGLRI